MSRGYDVEVSGRDQRLWRLFCVIRKGRLGLTRARFSRRMPSASVDLSSRKPDRPVSRMVATVFSTAALLQILDWIDNRFALKNLHAWRLSPNVNPLG